MLFRSQEDMPEDLKQVVLELGSYMMKLARKGEDLEENKNKLLENIENGKAYHKFIELVKNQGGEISYIENLEKLPKAKLIEPIYSKEEGIVQEINSKEIGILVGNLGASREKKEDKIDATVGIVLHKKVANPVKKGEILAYIHANDEKKLEEAKEKLKKIIKISSGVVRKEDTILEIINE